MFRFSIRDVLWLTVVVAMAVLLWLTWHNIPRMAKQMAGAINVAGTPLADGRVCLLAADGQIVGATVTKGQFLIQRVPVGTYGVTIEGSGVAAKYGYSLRLMPAFGIWGLSSNGCHRTRTSLLPASAMAFSSRRLPT
jgi:hypothetical protein